MARRIVTETSCDHCRRQTDVASYRVGNGVRLLRIELCPECGEYLDELLSIASGARRAGRVVLKPSTPEGIEAARRAYRLTNGPGKATTPTKGR